MKVGMRKPSIKKSIKARTTGKAKRAVKGAVNPLYGKKGMGWVNDPKKAAYNKVYNKTTIGVKDIAKATFEGEGNSSSSNNVSSGVNGCGCGCLAFVIIMFILIFIIF
ncbi:hypothetical protein [Clostridium sulfidigenes]|uniref:hypothetical protein n=1 Tax=Clostridium sulfidigenes TaxID=318464 RepID=UPI003F88895B